MLMIGSLNLYTKNLKMQSQWELKQRNGDYSGHKSLEQWLDAAQEEEDHGQKDDALRAIHQKLEAGGKLTPEERRYLQAKDPKAYAELEAMEREQKAFEQKLRQCRTKEEAQRLRMTYLNASLTTVKSVENNSAIPQQKKLEIMMREKQRCDKLDESFQKFVKTGEYEGLPTDGEATKAQKEENQAKQPQKPEKTPERDEPAPKEEAQEPEKPSVQVETPEQRKVKKARAKAAAAAYAGAAGCPDVAATASQVDLKA